MSPAGLNATIEIHSNRQGMTLIKKQT